MPEILSQFKSVPPVLDFIIYKISIFISLIILCLNDEHDTFEVLQQYIIIRISYPKQQVPIQDWRPWEKFTPEDSV